MSLSSGSMTGNGNTIVSGNLITPSGNLIINPAGPSTDFSGKNVGNINSLTVQTLNSGNIFNTGAIRTPVLSTQTGNLIINPAGSAIDFSGKVIINAILPPSQNANLLADTLRFPSVAPDLLLQSNGPQNLLLTSNTGTAASFEASSLRANVLTSTADLIISPNGPSIDFTDKNLLNAHIPPLFVGDESTIGINTVAEQSFFTTGVLRGSLTVPNSYFSRVGRGFKLEGYLRVFYGVNGSFTFFVRNNSVPIVLAVLPGTGLSDSTYKLEMILVCPDVNSPKATSFIITLTNLAGGVVSYSEGPGIAINGDYTLSFAGQYSVANSGNSARMMRTTILQV